MVGLVGSGASEYVVSGVFEPSADEFPGHGVAVDDEDCRGLHGSIVGRTVTDEKGAYSVELPAGDYSVKLNTYMRIVSGPIFFL